MTDFEKYLKAKENRSIIKEKIAEKGKVLITLNLNVPGLPKSNLLLSDFFNMVREQLRIWLLANRIFIENEEQYIQDAAGDFLLLSLKDNHCDPIMIKQITEQFEENHKLGRFIDVDVYSISGENISSGKSKSCFYCKKYPAIECRRNGTHNEADLRSFQERKIKSFIKKSEIKRRADKISSLALQSILYEISLTPKPGLVDKLNSGVHKDMDFNTFIDSTAAISVYFKQLVKKGSSCKKGDLPNALPLIRQVGLQMEKEMFKQTTGVNTQKGLIFLLGVALFACGYVLKKNRNFSALLFRKVVMKICKNIVETELPKTNEDHLTHGEIIYSKYNIGGVRSETENGFPTIFNHALPVLEKKGPLDDNSLIITLLSIMSKLDDTNVLFRSNPETLTLFKVMCENLVKNFSNDKYREIIDFCTMKKISPGGSADLLSIAIFIYLVKNNFC